MESKQALIIERNQLLTQGNKISNNDLNRLNYIQDQLRRRHVENAPRYVKSVKGTQLRATSLGGSAGKSGEDITESLPSADTSQFTPQRRKELRRADRYETAQEQKALREQQAQPTAQPQKQRQFTSQQRQDAGLAFQGYSPVATSITGDTLYSFNQKSEGKQYNVYQEYKPSVEEKLRINAQLFASKFKSDQTQQYAQIPFGVVSGGVSLVQGGYKLVTSPVESAKGIFSTSKEFLTNTRYRQDIFTNIRNNPAFFIGQVAGQYGAGKAVSYATETSINKAKDFAVSVGKTEIKIETVTTKSVISGKELMPRATSTADILTQFKKTKTPTQFIESTTRKTTKSLFSDNPNLASGEFLIDIKTPVSSYTRGGKLKVTSASPQKITGGVVEIGKKSAKSLEDTGIYTTPKGKASLYFTRLSKNVPTEYSFNPFAGLWGLPTVTEFKVGGITRYPRKIINKERGFDVVNKYQLDVLSKKSVVVIPKRSELSFGTAKYRGELTSNELQAVIPQGSKFGYKSSKGFFPKLQGFDKYFKYEGRNVAYREATVYGKNTRFKGGRVKKVSGNKIKQEQSYLNSRPTQSPYKYLSSFGSSIKAFSSISSKISSRSSAVSGLSGGYSSRSSAVSGLSGSYSSRSSAISGLNGRYSSRSSATSGTSGGYSNGSSSTATKGITFTPIFSVPKYEKQLGRERAGREKFSKQNKIYTPSITALFKTRNIFKRGKKSTGIGVASGLGVRF